MHPHTHRHRLHPLTQRPLLRPLDQQPQLRQDEYKKIYKNYYFINESKHKKGGYIFIRYLFASS
jgi:hypothetical protein